jgi:hypothetical protein
MTSTAMAGCFAGISACWSFPLGLRQPKQRRPTAHSDLGDQVLECFALESRLRKFRSLGESAAKRVWGPGGSQEPVLQDACKFVEVMLGGLIAQIKGLHADVTLTEGAPGAPSVATLALHLPCSMRAEVATPSKMPYDIRLLPDVEITLQLSTGDGPKLAVLRLVGLELTALDDMKDLRKDIESVLGPVPVLNGVGSPSSVRSEQNLDPEFRNYLYQALDWWEQTGRGQFPVRTCKFHRIHDALLQATFGGRAVTKDQQIAFFGNFLFTIRTPLEAMTFQPSMNGRRVTVTATRGPGTLQENELLACMMPLMLSSLRSFRPIAEKFAASAVNVGAMMYGHRIRQDGGDARVIIKLFTAATYWGVGTSGWRQYDQTASITGDQGRLLWRPEDTRACTSCAAEEDDIRRKPPGSCGCPCRRKPADGVASLDVPKTLSTVIIVLALAVAAARQASFM